jgi:transposase InsO family protein
VSWDITQLLGPAKRTYHYLYAILDVFSRYVVGWMVAHQERRVGAAADRGDPEGSRRSSPTSSRSRIAARR